MCSQIFFTYGRKAFFTIRVPKNHKISDICKNSFSIPTNEVLNESLWYQHHISCKKLTKKIKNPKFGQKHFCSDETYVKVLTKCAISLEILDGFNNKWSIKWNFMMLASYWMLSTSKPCSVKNNFKLMAK